METTFELFPALAGGIFIGLSAVLLLLVNGRIAGISGIVGGLMTPQAHEIGWRLAFIAGLVAGPLLLIAVTGNGPPVAVTSSAGLLIGGGLLVGYGSRLGGGCTSGHGVCGLARLSPRSLAATAVFMAAAIGTVFVMRHVIGA